MPAKYYLVLDRETRGPFGKEELERQSLRRDTLLWRKGLADWMPAGKVPELLDVFDDPPPLPGAAPVTVPPMERPPLPIADGAALPNLDIGRTSEQIKDPAVSVPRVDAPRKEFPRATVLPPVDRDRVEHDEDELRPLIRRGIHYDALGFRRLYVGGASVFIPGVILLLGFGIGLALLTIYGFERFTPRFDPQGKQIVTTVNDDVRGLESLCGIGLAAAAVIGLICTAIGATCFFILMYRAWAIIQDGRLRPSPGRAVGFLFIPFFNLYWTWVAIWGLACALNRFVRRYDLEAPPASQALGFTISLYSNMTYIPFPFAGLVPLGLNLILFPIFMRSIARTAAAICEDANRERIANAPLERTLRQPLLIRPVSAHILSIVATILPIIGIGMVVPGYCISLDSMQHSRRDARMSEALKQAIAHMRGLGALQPQDQQRLRNFENQANTVDRMAFRWRDDLMVSVAVLIGGVIFIVVAIALAYMARLCAQVRDEAQASLAHSQAAG